MQNYVNRGDPNTTRRLRRATLGVTTVLTQHLTSGSHSDCTVGVAGLFVLERGFHYRHDTPGGYPLLADQQLLPCREGL